MGGNINEQEQQNVPAQSRPYELPQNLVQVENHSQCQLMKQQLLSFRLSKRKLAGRSRVP